MKLAFALLRADGGEDEDTRRLNRDLEDPAPDWEL